MMMVVTIGGSVVICLGVGVGWVVVEMVLLGKEIGVEHGRVEN
jgi:hypothetical protein